jgi:hypothetical protein
MPESPTQPLNEDEGLDLIEEIIVRARQQKPYKEQIKKLMPYAKAFPDSVGALVLRLGGIKL